jgi:demethylmenaquinone methyltransferase/2-methoxy-6-polyprenyl-1,4-benzoquinol methylase
MPRSFDHFDLIARHYDRVLARSEEDPLPGIVDAHDGDLVLDVGGGTGRNASSLAAGGAQIVVCDRSLEMLKQARGKELQCVLADVRRLPFPDRSFDRVVAVDAFHHFVLPSASVAQPLAAGEMLRVVKAQGRVIIEEPDIRRRGVKWIALGEKLLLMRSRFLDPEALTRLFAASGAERVLSQADHFNMWLVFRP